MPGVRCSKPPENEKAHKREYPEGRRRHMLNDAELLLSHTTQAIRIKRQKVSFELSPFWHASDMSSELFSVARPL